MGDLAGLRDYEKGGTAAMKYHGIDAQFANLVKARFPFVYIPTWEEDRALQMIYDVAENTEFFQSGREVYV